jgi:hypothetical protein
MALCLAEKLEHLDRHCKDGLCLSRPSKAGLKGVHFNRRPEIVSWVHKTGFEGSYSKAEKYYTAIYNSYAYRQKVGYPPYLELESISGGGRKKSHGKSVDYELYRISQCGSLFASFLNQKVGKVRHKRCYCMKQLCPGCGGEGGRVHKRRKYSIYTKIESLNSGYKGNDKLENSLSKSFFRSHTFTIPEHIRCFFYDRSGLNWLMESAKLIIEKYYGEIICKKKNREYKYGLGDKTGFMTVHLFSEKQPDKFNPHINIDVIENDDGRLKKISPDTLSKLKLAWKEKLERYTGVELDEVSVEYHYIDKVNQMKHRIKYVTRPLNSSFLSEWKKNKKNRFIKMVLVDLKKFRHLRVFGKHVKSMPDEISIKELGESVFPGGGKNEFFGFVTQGHLNSLEFEKRVIKIDDDTYENIEVDVGLKKCLIYNY